MRKYYVLLVVILLLLMTACVIPLEGNKDLIRLEDYRNLVLTQEDATSQILQTKIVAIPWPIDQVEYTAKLDPIEVDGLLVQANHIDFSQHYAFVSYNYAGDEYKGALQIINIESATPSLKKTVIFSNADINYVYYDKINDLVLFGGQMYDEENKAFFSYFKENKANSGNLASIINDNLMFLDGRNVTSISSLGGIEARANTDPARYFFSTGFDGTVDGIHEYDEDFVEQYFYSEDDLRDIKSISTEASSLLFSLSGTNGLGYLYDNSFNSNINPLTSILANNKATLDLTTKDLMNNNQAVIHASLADNGFKSLFIDFDDMSMNEITNDSDFLANGLSTNDEFIYTTYYYSTTDFGFMIYKYTEDENIERIGKFTMHFLGSNISPNHIKYFNKNPVGLEKFDYLMVAAGEAGVYLFRLIDDD
ncbi:MAG: hypothetical protein ACQESN_02520 [Thermotogota bacterium]